MISTVKGQHIIYAIVLGVVSVYVGVAARGIGDAKGWTNTW